MGKPHLCFVVPPSPFLLDERVFMSLGILKVAAVAEEFANVEVLDLSGLGNYEEVIASYASNNRLDAFCLTVTTPQLPAVKRIARVIRLCSPRSKIIIGGPHVTLCQSAADLELRRNKAGRGTKSLGQLKELGDILVSGDGEKAIRVATEQNPPKLINANDFRSSLFLKNGDLDQTPWPARHLVDVDSYHYTIDGERSLSIISQLGCPFGCGFCGGRNAPSLRRIRSRTIPNVVTEMEHIYETYGIKGFMFYDDELNINERQMVEMMKMIIALEEKLGVSFRLRGFVKAELFTAEQAQLMYQAGFRWILSGFESGSPQILTNINKRATREQNTRCLELAHAHGLKVKALMSIGHPGESYASALATRDWLLKSKPDDFDLTVITVYPGTPYYDEAIAHPKEKGVWIYEVNGAKLHSIEIDLSETANFYKGDPNGGYESFVYTESLSSSDIVELRDTIERDIRRQLGIPYPPSMPAARFDHSMGQSGFPNHILRSSLVPQHPPS